MRTPLELDITTKEGLLKISKMFPNGIILIGNPQIGGTVLVNGNHDKLHNFASWYLGRCTPEEWVFVDLFEKIVTGCDNLYSKEMRMWRNTKDMENNPLLKYFDFLPEFLDAQTDLTPFSIMVCCCDEAAGVFAGNGEILYLGSLLMEMIRLGNIEIYDWLVKVIRDAKSYRK